MQSKGQRKAPPKNHFYHYFIKLKSPCLYFAFLSRTLSYHSKISYHVG